MLWKKSAAAASKPDKAPPSLLQSASRPVKSEHTAKKRAMIKKAKRNRVM